MGWKGRLSLPKFGRGTRNRLGAFVETGQLPLGVTRLSNPQARGCLVGFPSYEN